MCVCERVTKACSKEKYTECSQKPNISTISIHLPLERCNFTKKNLKTFATIKDQLLFQSHLTFL